MNRGFADREAFLEQVPDDHGLAPADGINYGSLGLRTPASPSCVATRGYVARTVGGGDYVFQRVDGEWRATGIRL